MIKLCFYKNEFGCELGKSKIIQDIMENVEGYEITDSLEEADYIIYAKNCAATFPRIETAINDIEVCLQNKKQGSKLIVSGCVAKSMNSEYGTIQRLNSILSKADYVVSEEIVFNIVEILKSELLKRDECDFFDMPPYSLKAVMNIADGCKLRCSFCKSNYMDFKLKSLTLDNVKEGIDVAVRSGARVIQLIAPNITEYGIDIYGKPVLQELLKYIRSIDEIKWIFLQELCVADLKNNETLIEELAINSKIKHASMQFSSGSERITKLMNRGYTIEEFRNIVNIIRSGNPDIALDTSLIAGFPTETEQDIRDTLRLVKELKYYVRSIWPYTNSEGVPSSKLPQFTEDEKNKRVRIYRDALESWNNHVHGEICQKPSLITCIAEGRPFVMAPDGSQYFFPEKVEKERVLGKKIKTGELI